MLSSQSRASLRSDSTMSSPNSRSSRRLEVVSKQATKVTAISTKLEWRIDQFEKLMKLFKNGHNLISKQFSCPQAPSVVWELHVYPNGKRDEDNNNVSFFLRQVGLQRGEDPIMTEFQIYTLDANNCRISVCRDTKDFTNQQGRGKFQVSREKMLASLRPDGSLMLICEVEYLPPGTKISVEQEDDCDSCDEMANKIEFSLRESMRDMFVNELFSDCTIQCGNKTFMVHRCILGQHSLVFRSMFSQKTMLEAQNRTTNITDFRPEIVRVMLEYIYTGSISSNLTESLAQGILAIADKYAVFPLKEFCEKYLASIISKKNVASMVIVADTYFASILKKACTRFISMHHKSIIRSPEWKELKNIRSELANDLLESVLNDHASFDLNGDDGDANSIDVINMSSIGGNLSIFTGGASNSFLYDGLSNNTSSNCSPQSLTMYSPMLNSESGASTPRSNATHTMNFSGGSTSSCVVKTENGRIPPPPSLNHHNYRYHPHHQNCGALQHNVEVGCRNLDSSTTTSSSSAGSYGNAADSTADEQSPPIRKRPRRGAMPNGSGGVGSQNGSSSGSRCQNSNINSVPVNDS